MGRAADTDPRADLAGRIMGFMLSQAIYVAAKLGVADRVADRPCSAAALAEAAEVDPDALYRLLRFLAGNGIFVEDDGRFANSDVSELLRDAPGSFRDFALIFGEEFYPAFAEPLRLLEGGRPAFDATFGAAWDDYLAAHPDKSLRFNRFMAGEGKHAVADVLAAAEWRDGETVVDVGGGNGALLVALLERRPDLRGIVFDLPHVAREAEERIASAELEGRCQVVAGNYFDGVPAGDVYVLSHILHGWDDDRASKIVGAIRGAVPESGRMLIVDGVVAPPNEPGMKLMDLLMLSLGGRERTEPEWRSLLERNGFELTAIRPAPFGGSVLEARPAT